MNGIRTIQVESARDLGPQFTDNPHRMVGQDGAFSFELRDGSSFWFFGDTLIGARVPNQSPWIVDGHLVDHRDMTGQGTYEKMHNNTGLILPKQSGENGLRDFRYLTEQSGQLNCLLPLEAGEDPDDIRMWCQHGTSLGDSIILSFIKIRMIPRKDDLLPVTFEILGSGLAIGLQDDWNFRRIRHDGDDLLWKANDPHFGVAFLRRIEDPFLYLYGSVSREGTQRVYLARVQPGHVGRLEEYEYLVSGQPEWSGDVTQTVALFNDMPSELSVSWNAHLNAYLAVHSLLLSGDITARTAPEPWGPWSAPVTLWHANVKHAYPLPYELTLIYAGKEHPQLSPDNGKTIYLTYIEFEEYFPHLIEVRLGD